MSSNYMIEEARRRPDSTAAICLAAIERAQWERANKRKAAVKRFFVRLFRKNV